MLNFHFTKKFDGTFTISFVGEPQEITGNGYVFKTNKLNNLVSIKKFIDKTEGENNTIHFTKYFKYRNSDKWSELLPIEQITGLTLIPCNDFELELYYFRTIDGAHNTNNSSTQQLYVHYILIMGEYKISEFDSVAILNKNESAILKPKDIYKIFSLTGFNVQASNNTYDIMFRFTQDNGRTYTQWEPLTIDNITTVRLNPLRFAQVEYLITNTGNEKLAVYDIILEGDFQNVSANYLKTNKYGLKEDCVSIMLLSQNNILSDYPMPGSSYINRDFLTSCISTYQTNTNIAGEIDIENMNNDAINSYWNPYQYQKIVDFSSLLGNQISTIFGWTVDYHITDPDGNGIDKYIHEYTLKNVVDVKKIKVIVPNNKFPVEHVLINQFNLNMFDTFEIHITKDEFKKAFGITKRPSEDDIIYFCEANMLYYVKHAQAKKDIMNASTYYRLILEKYEYKTNIRNLIEASKNEIEALTNNTTIHELFGEDMIETEKQIANKEQTYPLTFDKIRHSISNKVMYIKNNIYVGNFLVSKQQYDLSNPHLKNKTAVNYNKIDRILKKSDNRSFVFWFNFKNGYDPDKRPDALSFRKYNIEKAVDFVLLDNYSANSGLGYKIFYKNDTLFFKLNNDVYGLTKELLTNVWYAGVIILNQRIGTLDMYIYKRDCSIDVMMMHEETLSYVNVPHNSTEFNDLLNQGYKPIDNIEGKISNDMVLIAFKNYNIIPTEFNINENLRLIGSNIKLTNIRVLNDIIPENSIINILKQDILRDEQHLILGDNATKRLVTSIYFNPNFR